MVAGNNKTVTWLPNLVASVLLIGPMASVQAQDWTASTNIGLTSDYMFRGVTQTDHKPAVQGGVELAHSSGFYGGLWGSNVDEVVSSDKLEIDTYLGFRNTVGEFSYDSGVTRYNYPGNTTNTDYNEFFFKGSYHWLNGGIYYANDVSNTGGDGYYYTVGVQFDLPAEFKLAASAGYSEFGAQVVGPGNPRSYADWKLGVSRGFAGLDFDVSYYDTDSDARRLFGGLCRRRVVLTVSKSW